MNGLSFEVRISLLFLIPLGLYLLWSGFYLIREKIHWRLSDRVPFSMEFQRILEEEIRPFGFLSEEEKTILIRKVKYFLHTKNISGVGDFVVTDRMKLIVAAEACLLILRVSPRVYPGLTNIFLMEDTYLLRDNPVDPRTGRPVDSPKLGEAWKRGPIVLSWKAIEKDLRTSGGTSHLIAHEFSHNLDQQDGSFDGTPRLGSPEKFQRWAGVMGREFLTLRKRLRSARTSDIDAYGATNEAEFFAVLTEYYVRRPRRLKKFHPEIYQAFDQFFKINPLRWDSENV